jgi:hypothetical protein
MGHNKGNEPDIKKATEAEGGGWAIDTCTECGNVHLVVVVPPSFADRTVAFTEIGAPAQVAVRAELVANPDQAEALAVALIKDANRLRALERGAGKVITNLFAAAKGGG